MIELIDIIFNQYLRIFVGIVLVGLVIFSLYYSYKDKLKKLLRFKTDSKDK
jgi:hypothetical protein